eukprot:gene10379-biopygen10819
MKHIQIRIPIVISESGGRQSESAESESGECYMEGVGLAGLMGLPALPGRKVCPEGRKVRTEDREVGSKDPKVCTEGRKVCPDGRRGVREGL